MNSTFSLKARSPSPDSLKGRKTHPRGGGLRTSGTSSWLQRWKSEIGVCLSHSTTDFSRFRSGKRLDRELCGSGLLQKREEPEEPSQKREEPEEPSGPLDFRRVSIMVPRGMYFPRVSTGSQYSCGFLSSETPPP